MSGPLSPATHRRSAESRPTPSTPRYAFIVATNDESILHSSLLASPDLATGVELFMERRATSAASAYNRGIRETRAEIMVFVHQDVFLPPGWLERFTGALTYLAQRDPHWGVLGLFGDSPPDGTPGWVYCTGNQRLLGSRFSSPQRVRLLDELLLVVRRSSGLVFDERLPGFHMYGTDVCLEAEARGMHSYVLPCFAVHNTNGISRLPWAFWRACWYVWRKHHDRLPIHSPCVLLPRHALGFAGEIVRRHLVAAVRRQPVGTRVPDPAALYRGLLQQGMVPDFRPGSAPEIGIANP